MAFNREEVDKVLDYFSMKYIEDYSMGNLVLVGEILDLKNRAAGLACLRYMAQMEMSSYKRRLFPVLADAIHKVEYVCRLVDTDTDEQIEEKFFKLYDILEETHNHIYRGQRDHDLNKKELGMYDAMLGVYQKDFNLDMVQVTHEFSTYIQVYPFKMLLSGKEFDPEKDCCWVKVLEDLWHKYKVFPYDMDDAYSYISEVVVEKYKKAADTYKKYVEADFFEHG